MERNDFRTDTAVQVKKDFIGRIGATFTAAIFLTGISFAAGVWGVAEGVRDCVWAESGAAPFVWKIFQTAIMLLIFLSLVKIAVDEKPFSKTLTWCIRIIGILLAAASAVMPRLEGYRSSGFEILSAGGGRPLIDGAILLAGLLLIILGNIIMAGFYMQKEMDEIL